MSHNYLLPVLFFYAFAVLISACGSPAAESVPALERPPNILLIMTDDQGWGDLGFHGNDSIDTPVLDSLARTSIRFDRFYVSPVCAPTRASLLTGRYHFRTGTSFVTARREVMRTEEVTIAEILQRHQYATGLFGKWHNGAQYPNDPLAQGFDTFFGFTAGHWNNYFNTNLMDGRTAVPTTGFITDVLTERAVGFMTDHRDEPFFCYVPYNAPHGPFQVPDRYFDKYKAMGLTDKNAAVYGMVDNVDDNVGRLLRTLDELGLKENTIVVFLTDNGPNGDRFNGGMRGWKASVHEGGSRVPLFISWPGTLTGGREVKELAAHIDLLPTLLDLAGISLPDSLSLDGRSLVPLLKGQEIAWPERSLYTTHMSWDTDKVVGALRNNSYRMVVEGNGRTQLYNMQKDPGETTDLATDFPKTADSLRLEFDTWLADARSGGLQPPPITLGNPNAPETFLPAPEASLEGSVHFKGDGWANDWITGWKTAGDKVSWPVKIDRPATYQLTLYYNLPETGSSPALQISLGDQTMRSTINQAFPGQVIPSPDRISRGEVYEKSWGEWPVTLEVPAAGISMLEIVLQHEIMDAGFELEGVKVNAEH
ncbi:MAG: arylsulfatase [Saprospiraceae bacterium]|nr:arylsulfatase [Lewinella sp.]